MFLDAVQKNLVNTFLTCASVFQLIDVVNLKVFNIGNNYFLSHLRIKV